jgi:3-oxoacyl-[acyl-carrier-protein] synthase III
MRLTERTPQDIPTIAGISYVFPEGSRTVSELAGDRQLSSSAATMESFGFGNVHVAVAETPYELGLAAASKLLDETGVDRDSVGLLIYGGTPGSMSFAAADEAEDSARGLCTMSRFKYPATRLQYDLDLRNAWPFAVDQLACTTLLGAARIARSLCLT